MKLLKVRAFTVPELSDKAKEKAMNWLSEAMFSGDWYECIINYWNDKLERFGFNNPKIEFSGFYSQGDGASFTATVDLAKWIGLSKERTKKYKSLLPDISDGIIEADVYRISSHYVHSGTVTAQVSAELEAREKFASLLDDVLEKELENEVEELCKEIYSDLKADYKNLSSEESLTDLATANDYLFDKFGNPIHHLAN